MKIKKNNRAISLSVLLFLSSPFSTVFAHSEHCEIKETELGETMKFMKSELRAYVKAFKSENMDNMQRHLDQLIQLIEKAEKLTPVSIMQLDHEQMDINMAHKTAEMEHSKMDHGEMSRPDHDMSKMAGMSNEQHHQHMKYIQGMTKLQGLFQQLDESKDREEVKKILGNIKQHSKQSHHSFRQNCD